MEVVKAAWWNERFSFSGKHFTLPPPGIPDRGSTVKDLTLIPKPIAPIDIWQAVTSPPTLDYCARVRHHAVMPARGPGKTKIWWDRYAEAAASNGWDLAPGEARCLAINCHLGDTKEAAIASGRGPHDEWVKFLAPYGRFRAYDLPGGGEVPFDHRPSIEDSIDQRQMLIGSVDEVVDMLSAYRELLDLEHVVLFFDMPGLTQEQMDEQLQRMAREVLPQLGVRLDGTG